jgi:hypothetical protein
MNRTRAVLPIALSCLGAMLITAGILGGELPMILRKAIYIWLEPLGLMSWAYFLNLTFTGTYQWVFSCF